MGCRHHGAGYPARSRRSRSEPRQSARRPAYTADDARPVDLRVRRLRGRTEGAILPPRAQVAHQQATLLYRSMKARMEGKPLPEFRFHDFGSLVSLGELSAVGTLMGRLVGGSLLIQGLIARLMYTSLYKMHQVSIHGIVRVAFDTVGRMMRGRVEPRVKLH